jgi:hypothetical protein
MRCIEWIEFLEDYRITDCDEIYILGALETA